MFKKHCLATGIILSLLQGGVAAAETIVKPPLVADGEITVIDKSENFSGENKNLQIKTSAAGNIYLTADNSNTSLAFVGKSLSSTSGNATIIDVAKSDVSIGSSAQFFKSVTIGNDSGTLINVTGGNKINVFADDIVLYSEKSMGTNGGGICVKNTIGVDVGSQICFKGKNYTQIYDATGGTALQQRQALLTVSGGRYTNQPEVNFGTKDEWFENVSFISNSAQQASKVINLVSGGNVNIYSKNFVIESASGNAIDVQNDSTAYASNMDVLAENVSITGNIENGSVAKIHFGTTDIPLKTMVLNGNINNSGTSGSNLENGVIDIHTSEQLIINGNIDNCNSGAANNNNVLINQGNNNGGSVQISGNLLTGDNDQGNANDNITSSIKIKLDGSDSFLKGNVIDYNQTSTSKFLDQAGNTAGTYLELDNGAVWYNRGYSVSQPDSIITSLTLNNKATLDMLEKGNQTIHIRDLHGNNGLIKLGVDLQKGTSDKIFVTRDFDGIQKLDITDINGYVPTEDDFITGTGIMLGSSKGTGIFEANEQEGTLFYTSYDLEGRTSTNDTDKYGAIYDTDWFLTRINKNTDEPTTSVDTVLSANALNYHTWRTENDKLLQRMGELRYNGEAAKGAWFRVKGSKIGREGKFGFENKYTAYELGYDEVTKRTAEKTRYQGAALSYTDGSGSYSRGSGDNSSKAISFYNTEMGSKGHYLDLVFKISNMDNDFTVYDTNSKKITGDFNNTGVALSAEYGRKNDLQNGWYIEPQAQFTLGYFGGDNYVTSNGIEVNQSGIKSAVGRIGFNIGKQIGSKGLVYAKANLLHEFGGGYDVTMADSSGQVKVSDSFNDTWFEYGIGAALAAGKNSHVYFDVERSAGSDFTKDWQWNAGVRWNF
ncbi:autotransporter outer membrane beta-barrel domain-containing protein [Phascolarctobacterium faecium]|uniref:autotransporter family protein n=1 Tax=Phascolarctobacterium faecium TaxID=33025 RepID=UPI00265D9A97|nr:autotransporter outer membrane beta-barrel domain-containing protein [Phascolarctobacterium faecium]